MERTIIHMTRFVVTEGDTVIDPVCGSGITLRAAAELNRNSYGFETNTKFYNAARDTMLKDYITNND